MLVPQGVGAAARPVSDRRSADFDSCTRRIASMVDPFWSAARSRMLLDPTVINLNTGSFGPLPRPVFERATELRLLLAAEPMDCFVRRLPPLLWEARERLATLLGGDPRRLVFTENVTTAVNL